MITAAITICSDCGESGCEEGEEEREGKGRERSRLTSFLRLLVSEGFGIGGSCTSLLSAEMLRNKDMVKCRCDV